MRSLVFSIVLLLACSGCQQGPFPRVGRAAFLEHWFPVAHTDAAKGINTRSRPPCPYFDPPPCNGAYAFCEECGVYHVVKTK